MAKRRVRKAPRQEPRVLSEGLCALRRGNIYVPTGCRFAQIVIQRAPDLPGDKRYTVDGDLWDQLNNDSRAALILHEVIYKDALERGQNNSRRARYFNSLVFSNKLTGISPSEYQTLAHAALMDVFEIRSTSGVLEHIYYPTPVTYAEAVRTCYQEQNGSSLYGGDATEDDIGRSSAEQYIQSLPEPAQWIWLFQNDGQPLQIGHLDHSTWWRLTTHPATPNENHPYICRVMGFVND